MISNYYAKLIIIFCQICTAEVNLFPHIENKIFDNDDDALADKEFTKIDPFFQEMAITDNPPLPLVKDFHFVRIFQVSGWVVAGDWRYE